jgi:hypothetical protein
VLKTEEVDQKGSENVGRRPDATVLQPCIGVLSPPMPEGRHSRKGLELVSE